MGAGEIIRPGGLDALKVVLSNTFRIVVFRDICEWVHPLYDEHVQPVMLQYCQQLQSTLAEKEER